MYAYLFLPQPLCDYGQVCLCFGSQQCNTKLKSLRSGIRQIHLNLRPAIELVVWPGASVLTSLSFIFLIFKRIMILSTLKT